MEIFFYEFSLEMWMLYITLSYIVKLLLEDLKLLDCLILILYKSVIERKWQLHMGHHSKKIGVTMHLDV